jgi:hypothetical protein
MKKRQMGKTKQSLRKGCLAEKEAHSMAMNSQLKL